MKDKLMEKMEQNKAFVVVIILLVLLVLGLIVYIIYDKISADDTSKAKTEVTTEATESTVSDETEEATVAEADESDEGAEDEISDAKKSDDASKKYACYAKLSAENNWNDGDAVVYQYSLDIHNKSDEDISDWEVKISGFEGGEIGDSWNGTYKISGDTLSVTAVDYNVKVLAYKLFTIESDFIDCRFWFCNPPYKDTSKQSNNRHKNIVAQVVKNIKELTNRSKVEVKNIVAKTNKN